MKKTLFCILTFLLFSLICSQAFADLIFEDSHLEADIQEDGTIKVQEFFDVNFLSEMHGIQREIPEYYTVDITKFKIFLDNVKVPGEHFEVLPYWKTKNIRIAFTSFGMSLLAALRLTLMIAKTSFALSF